MSGPTSINISRNLPGLGPDPDYSRAVYPDPPSHDFCAWLIQAELMRRFMGAPAPLRVRLMLVNGQLGIFDYGHVSLTSATGPYRLNLPKSYSDVMIPHVLRPAMAMLGAVEDEGPADLDFLVNWVEYDHHIKGLVDAARQGHEIPKWRVPLWAHDIVDNFLARVCAPEKPIVITLRESAMMPERNSQVWEWLKFAKLIKDRYPVVFVRDTAKCEVPLHGFRAWRRAAENAYIRAALYQRAMVNMMVGNGPGVWCIFSEAPYLIFKQLIPALPNWQHGQPIGWREQDHMEVGDQYPWASRTQRLTWTDDTFGNIVEAFDAFPGASVTG